MHKDTLILGKTRRAWMIDVIRALIAATDPATRMFILDQGFYKFEQLLILNVPNETALTPTTTERRFMWDYLYAWVRSAESKFECNLWPGIRRMAEATRRRDSTSRFDVEEAGDPEWEVDAVRDGTLRRVK